MSNLSLNTRIAFAAIILCLAIFASQGAKLADLYPAEGFYYRTPLALGGAPIVDVRFPPRRVDHEMTVQSQLDLCLARGFIAIGPYAVGFVAIGGGSVGILSVGMFSLAVWNAVGVVGIAASRACGVLAIAPNRFDVATVKATKHKSVDRKQLPTRSDRTMR